LSRSPVDEESLRRASYSSLIYRNVPDGRLTRDVELDQRSLADGGLLLVVQDKKEAKMNFTMPRYADANDIVDRALRANARDVPVSVANLMPTLRWNLARLELSESMLVDSNK